MAITVVPSFRLQRAQFSLDGSALDAATTLKQHAEAIKLLVRRTCKSIAEIGHHLTEAQELAGHGKWLRWLDQEFGWSEQTARNYMRVFEMVRKSTTIVDLDLPLRALYVLAAPSTPESLREEIIERAASGEKISYEQVGQEITEAKALSKGKAESRERKQAPEPPTPKEIFDRIIDLAAQLNRDDQLRIALRIRNMAMGRAC
jgi:hypothetical protein